MMLTASIIIWINTSIALDSFNVRKQNSPQVLFQLYNINYGSNICCLDEIYSSAVISNIEDLKMNNIVIKSKISNASVEFNKLDMFSVNVSYETASVWM